MTSAIETGQAAGKRERSTIAFPYGDLDSAVNVARTVYTRAAGSCGLDQLAAWLGYSSINNGAFRTQANTARIFGLLTTSRKTVELTDLGVRMADPDQEAPARAEAFLAVPLYRKTFDDFRGRTLPPDSGLEIAFARMGVASKQTDKARQAFQRSAQQAGFFDAGSDRLIEPSFQVVAEETAPEATGHSGMPPADMPLADSASGHATGLHPFIQGLIETLPVPGTQWSDTERKEWLTAAEHIFALIYKAERKAIPQSVPDTVEQATA